MTMTSSKKMKAMRKARTIGVVKTVVIVAKRTIAIEGEIGIVAKAVVMELAEKNARMAIEIVAIEIEIVTGIVTEIEAIEVLESHPEQLRIVDKTEDKIAVMKEAVTGIETIAETVESKEETPVERIGAEELMEEVKAKEKETRAVAEEDLINAEDEANVSVEEAATVAQEALPIFKIYSKKAKRF